LQDNVKVNQNYNLGTILVEGHSIDGKGHYVDFDCRTALNSTTERMGDIRNITFSNGSQPYGGAIYSYAQIGDIHKVIFENNNN